MEEDTTQVCSRQTKVKKKNHIPKVFAVWNSSSLKARTTWKYEVQDDLSANHAISQVIKCLFKQARISIEVWLLQFTSWLETFCFYNRNTITIYPLLVQQISISQSLVCLSTGRFWKAPLLPIHKQTEDWLVQKDWSKVTEKVCGKVRNFTWFCLPATNTFY